MATGGSIYKQPGSRFWWIQYYVPGQKKPIRESAKTEDYAQAQNELWKRLGQVGAGSFIGLEPERIKVDELLAMLVDDYELNSRSSLRQMKLRVENHLRPFFGQMRAATVGTRQISSYVAKRKKEKKANATINREIEHLRRAFALGFDAQPQLVLRPMKYKKLDEDNVREGLLEHAQYAVLRNGLPEPYKTLFVCGYHLGAREGELLKIHWSEVDFSRNEIVLLRYTTKGKTPRTLPIYGEMAEFLRMIKATRDQLYPACPWVFQRQGKKMVFDHQVWKNHVGRLGAENLLFHDLRRTAITTMIEAGISEKEAMRISGHKTDATFRRYHIVKRARLQVIGQKLGEYHKTLPGHDPHTSDIVSSIVPVKTAVH